MLSPSEINGQTNQFSPIVSKIEVRDGRVAERARGELGYVVARHVELTKDGARHSRKSSEAIQAEVQHLRFI